MNCATRDVRQVTKVPPKPNFIGNLCIKDHPIKEIVEFIDWTPFFQVIIIITINNNSY